MKRVTKMRSVGLLLAIGLVAAGCGGAPVEDPAAAGTPTPDAGATGTPVADPNAAPVDPAAAGTGAIDPVTGLPVTDTSGLSATATIPEVSGGDVSGGLGAVGGSDVFAAAGLDQGEAAKLLAPKEDKTDDVATGTDTTAETAKPTVPAVVYNAAVIYVNGKTYTVPKSGTFPTAAPVFRLISIDKDSVEISLLAGEFTGDGSDGLFLDQGDLVKLLDQSANITYKTKYLRPVVDAASQGF